MAEILLTIFFISVLLFFLGSGIWVAVSMIGVSAIGMMLFTSRPVGDAMATTIWHIFIMDLNSIAIICMDGRNIV